jgi:glycine cleavage system transcriptional repressor
MSHSSAAALRSYMVLTAVGPDRPGLVEQISSLLHRAGANLEDSRMAILGGEFALILLFTGSAEAITIVSSEGQKLALELDLTLSLKETRPRTQLTDFVAYQLRVSGVDRTGIVARVSSLLAGRKINVAALDSRIEYAPLSGTPMFHLSAALQVPSQLALASLRSDIALLCEHENLDFQLESR